jgi:hypothetical protein
MIMAWRLTLHGLTLRSARVGTAAAAAKMSRSMVPFASLISTGLRLMNELRTFQRGPGPGTLGRGQTRRTRRRATAAAGPSHGARARGRPGLRVGLGLRLGTPVPGRGRRCGRVTGNRSSVTACLGPASASEPRRPGYRHGPPGARAGRRAACSRGGHMTASQLPRQVGLTAFNMQT